MYQKSCPLDILTAIVNYGGRGDFYVHHKLSKHHLKGGHIHDLERLDFSSKGPCTSRMKDFIMRVRKYLPNC